MLNCPDHAQTTTVTAKEQRVKVLLVPVGSAGDMHPFIGLGLALRGRGHDVTVVAHAHFEPLLRQVGLACVPVGQAEDYETATQNPDLWHPRKGLRSVVNLVLAMVESHYRIIRDSYVKGETVVAAAGVAFGARCAREKLGVPLATIHLQPTCLWSAHQAPRFPLLPMPDWLPPPAKRLMYRAIDWAADRTCAAQINAFRADLELPPVSCIFHHWWHSPQRVIGLFPDWFAAPQPDWPPQTVLTGFNRYDRSDVVDLPADLARFLDAGDPPLVFTPGSANRHGRRFFDAAAEACRRLDRRGVFLTPFAEQVPDPLPTNLRHFDYVPLGQLLPRAAALIHHGGIGTLAQGLAAGLPQLLMPMSHDQPDNAQRLQRLGVGDSLSRRAFRGPAVARRLARLLDSPAVHAACRATAQKMRDRSSIADTCTAIEQLVGTDALSSRT